MTELLSDVECEMCRTELSHDDPTWLAQIVDGQAYPLCVECAALAGYTKEGVE